MHIKKLNRAFKYNLNALLFVVQQSWKYWIDSIKVQGDRYVILEFMTREWLP